VGHMLTEYYKERGCDKETGVPEKETLKALEIDHLADELMDT
jgi:aldehyde:ferredoxin oxidoreductase